LIALGLPLRAPLFSDQLSSEISRILSVSGIAICVGCRFTD
jgi:hypothetical protein